MANTILTTIGRQKLISAAPERQVKIQSMVFGDGGGNPVSVNEDMQWVVNQVSMQPAAAPIRAGDNADIIMISAIIPRGVTGFTVREVGLVDADGDLIAIGASEPTDKKESPLSVRVYLKLDNASQVELISNVSSPLDHSLLTGRDSFNAHDASAIRFKQEGDGAVARSLSDKAQEWVSVKDHGAVGDGVANDQVALESIILFAYENNMDLHWPDGEYVSTKSIPHFHDVTHYGTGKLIRGENTWHISPKGSEENIVYLSPSGLSANDGLSPLTPMSSIKEGMEAIKKWERALLGGLWKIKALAGTYTTSYSTSSFPVSLNPITIEGDYSGEWPTITCNTIFVAPTTNQGYFIYYTGGTGRRINIYGIKFEGYRSAVCWWGGGNVQVRYCSFHDCDITIWNQGQVDISIRWNHFENCGRCAYIQYSSRGAVYYNTVKNCNLGFEVTRDSSAHVDYIDFDGVDVACIVNINSRITANYNKYRNTNIAYSAKTGGIIDESDCDYGIIGSDTKQVFELLGTGTDVRYNGYDGARDHVKDVWATFKVIDKNNTDFLTSPRAGAAGQLIARSGYFFTRMRKLRVVIYGHVDTKTNTQGVLDINDQRMSVNFPDDSGPSKAYTLSFDFFSPDTGQTDSFGRAFPASGGYWQATAEVDGMPISKAHGVISGANWVNQSAVTAKIGIFTEDGTAAVRRVEWYVR